MYELAHSMDNDPYARHNAAFEAAINDNIDAALQYVTTSAKGKTSLRKGAVRLRQIVDAMIGGGTDGGLKTSFATGGGGGTKSNTNSPGARALQPSRAESSDDLGSTWHGGMMNGGGLAASPFANEALHLSLRSTRGSGGGGGNSGAGSLFGSFTAPRATRSGGGRGSGGGGTTADIPSIVLEA